MESSRSHHWVLLSSALLILVFALLRLHPLLLHPKGKGLEPVLDPLPELAVELGSGVPNPGIYFLPKGSCVGDLLDEAKAGSIKRALSSRQSAIALDPGTSVAIEADEKGETVVSIRPMDASKRYLLNIPIDLNSASVEDLQVLPGIGHKTATAIVAFRNQWGPFSSLSELERVPRLGPKRVEALSRYLMVNSK